MLSIACQTVKHREKKRPAVNCSIVRRSLLTHAYVVAGNACKVVSSVVFNSLVTVKL